MKNLLFVLFMGVALVSCSKKDVVAPRAANQNVDLRNSNVEVQNLKAVANSSNDITVSFATTYENNITRVELMSSGDGKTFCTTQGIDTQNNSESLKPYAFQDSNIKGTTMYYMVRFKDSLGNWYYTDDCTVTVQ